MMEIENNSNNQNNPKKIKDDENHFGRMTIAPNKIKSVNNNKELSLSTRTSDASRLTLPVKFTIINFNFKIILIGDISVGKSSIIKRYINNSFNSEYFCTIGTELSKKTVIIGENKKVNLFIWDTCGQEKFRSVTRQYYIDSQGIILVFDLTNKNSFNDLQSWYDEAINYINNKNCIFFLFGNKSDEKNKKQVSKIDIKNFMRKNHRIKKYFEVSALSGDNIELSFDKICYFLVIQYQGDEMNNEYKRKQLSSVELSNNLLKKDKDSCC